MELCQRSIRSDYQSHLMIPGKKQKGPTSLVSKSCREILPALAFLFDHLEVNDTILGRCHRNVKDDRIPVFEGSFPATRGGGGLDGETIDSSYIAPVWLFRSTGLAVLLCRLRSSRTVEDIGDSNVADLELPSGADLDKHMQDRATALQTCVDNVIFRLGKEAVGSLDILLDQYLEYSFAAGSPQQAEQLRQEILHHFNLVMKFKPIRLPARWPGSCKH